MDNIKKEFEGGNMPIAKMKLWNSVCQSDPRYLKKVDYGFKYTAIGMQYQIMEATGLWGPYGTDWGVRDCRYGMINDAKGQPIEMYLEAKFYYPNDYYYSGDKDIIPKYSIFDISTDIKFSIGGDCRKKLLTDLTTKALSKLGFNADVFMGDFDDNKYTDKDKNKNEKPKGLTPYTDKDSRQMLTAFKNGLLACKNLKTLESYKLDGKDALLRLTKNDMKEAGDYFNTRKGELNE